VQGLCRVRRANPRKAGLWFFRCANLEIVPRVRRPLAISALAAAALAAGPGASAPAQAAATGGSVAGEPQVPAVGGGTAPTGGTGPTGVPSPSTGANGGNRYGRPFRIPPVIRRFSASPRIVVFGGAPTRLHFRVEAIGATTSARVRVRLTAHRAGGGTTRVNLGRRRVNRNVTVRWARAGIAAGTYSLTLTVVDARGRTVARAAGAGLRVWAKPPTPPAPAPAPGSRSGVFPVAGPHSYGDGFGVDRGDHIHQGQDIPAADGTPLVAPRPSTVFATGYSASGSGEYVVLYDSSANRSYVYFHLHNRSTVVSYGQSVRAGQLIGAVGSTGHSTGPHLHFELWIGRWFDGGHAVDPLPTLRSWER
jgi:murein DD-endopeptidase MepM/ murein hydrolase activator NlpD